MARQLPTTKAKARAGGFTADVDTEGMDPEMKKTLTTPEGDNPVQKFFRNFGKKKVAPAKPIPKATPKPLPKMSQDEEDRLSKKYLGG
jgi:hypothetical protein